MEQIAEFNAKNYREEWPVFTREAARAVILRNGKIAMLKSRTEGFYKFPGGGIEPGESHLDTLV